MEELIKKFDQLKKRQEEDRAELQALKSYNVGLRRRIEILEENLSEIIGVTHFVQDSKLTDFEIIGKLGSSKDSDVYKVRYNSNQRIYAIKKVRISTGFSKFRKIIERLSELNHTNVVRYYGGWIEPLDDDGQSSSSDNKKPKTRIGCIQMKCYSRNNLQDIIVFGGLTDYNRRHRLFREIISGLIYIHGQDIVHFNLTLENILLDNFDHIKIGGLDSMQSIIFPDETAPKFPQASSHQKVDIYFLGLIYFVMCYTPIQTKAKLTKFFQDFSETCFSLPDDSGKYLFPEDIQLVEKMLHHEAKSRPHIRQVLKFVDDYFKKKSNPVA